MPSVESSSSSNVGQTGTGFVFLLHFEAVGSSTVSSQLSTSISEECEERGGEQAFEWVSDAEGFVR